ncbi:hypothetical protein DICVIV_05389 [Dictyocaulus viviparus]|uniref:Plexin TIG domain-containing protein n=1 Tax=Dictyocaulus viviparus TaxID=29172 RepID=A0A0D8XXI4_DICVI|nr:hypothetical protein DICVIV_05389 [Dictyocaulus viviparus]
MSDERFQFKSKSPAQLEEYNRRNVGDTRSGFRVQQIYANDVTIYAVLPQGVSVCPTKNGRPSPSSISVDELKNVTLPINHLPQPDGFTYVCVFGSSTTVAVWTEYGVLCPLSKLSTSRMEPSYTERMALTTSMSSYRIVEYNLTVYNCGAFITCSSCSSSETGCDWCLDSQKCVPKWKMRFKSTVAGTLDFHYRDDCCQLNERIHLSAESI